jgi:hypothetical protein
VIADIFSWVPERRYDAVVFCFWLSHVPNARVDMFLRSVASAVRPGGHMFFAASLPASTSGRADRAPSPRDGEIQHRQVQDGREFDVVKNYWSSDDLRARFLAAGLDVDVRETANYFQYGAGQLL